jgi:hypothetical protein
MEAATVNFSTGYILQQQLLQSQEGQLHCHFQTLDGALGGNRDFSKIHA